MPKFKLFDSEKIKNIHFIGIGGVSMSGLAELLLNYGYTISGSDVAASYTTEKLIKVGIKVNIGHRAENIKSPDLVVYTAAINEANPELIKARETGCLVIDRATLLGEIMKHFPCSNIFF